MANQKSCRKPHKGIPARPGQIIFFFYFLFLPFHSFNPPASPSQSLSQSPCPPQAHEKNWEPFNWRSVKSLAHNTLSFHLNNRIVLFILKTQTQAVADLNSDY